MTPRDHRDVLAEHVVLDGADVLDVGCGAGGLVRWMRSRGARPVGVECGESMRAEAMEADPVHAADYLDGVGQALPCDDRSFDVVVFSYSLHHVPAAAMADAIREARRVLRTGGQLYVLEPFGRSADTYAAFPVVDERVEQAAAQAVLDRAAGAGFEERSDVEYESESEYDGVDGWLAVLVGVDPERADAVARHERDLRERFERLGVERDGRVVLASGNRARTFVAV